MQSGFKKFLNKLERLAIPSLMKHLVIIMGVVFVLDLFFNGELSRYLMFSRSGVFNGEIWRVISFVFIPISTSPLFLVFVLYFYWMIGEALEQEWGVAKFNLFYLVGIIGTVIAGLITGFATNHYLNLSLFFAFAILFPEFPIRLFFLIPIKVKWLAYANAAYFAYALIISSWPERIALIVSLINVILFFQKPFRRRISNLKRQQEWRKHFK